MALARWQATIVDDAGNVQSAASVEVRAETGGAPLATIYSDRDGAVPISNPLTADADGFAAFHVSGGAYKITATKGAFSREWRYVAIGTAAESDAGAFQPIDADLTAIAALTGTGFAVRTGDGTWVEAEIVGTANEITVTNGDGVAANPSLSFPATIDLGGKTSFEIPNSATPTVDANGEIAVDTSVTDFSHGLIRLFGGEELFGLCLPVANLASPSDGHVLTYDAANDEFKLAAPAASGLISATAQATASGTSFDFTSLPASIKRLSIVFNEVSLSGTNDLLVQIGDSGGLETTGYVSSGGTVENGASGAVASSTAGFLIRVSSATRLFSGVMTLLKISGNIWISEHAGKIATTFTNCGGGSKTLSATLDRVRILATGADTFDNASGSVNIFYE